MKKLGLVGGMGPESTIPYYHDIVYGVQERVGKSFFPNLTIESVNVFDVLQLCSEQKYDELADYLMSAINNLVNSGADFVALSANTPHIVFDKLQQKSSVPLISIVEATRDEALRLNMRKVGLMGTIFTMTGEFFKKPFSNSIDNSSNIEIVVPTVEEMEFINEKISSELELGIVIDNLVVGYNYMELEESNLIDKAKEKGINIIYMREGDYLTDGSFVMKAIHPSAQFESDDKNQMSLVLTYKSDNFSALFTGDIGEEAILNILEKGGLEEDVDILKVPHHGSRYSLSMRFLEKINPDIAVISCGRKNSYGHPHKEVLYGLDKIECTVFTTPKCGAVVIEKK